MASGVAASHAIDRTTIADADSLGASPPMGSLIPPGVEFALPTEPHPYDPARPSGCWPRPAIRAASTPVSWWARCNPPPRPSRSSTTSTRSASARASGPWSGWPTSPRGRTRRARGWDSITSAWLPSVLLLVETNLWQTLEFERVASYVPKGQRLRAWVTTMVVSFAVLGLLGVAWLDLLGSPLASAPRVGFLRVLAFVSWSGSSRILFPSGLVLALIWARWKRPNLVRHAVTTARFTREFIHAERNRGGASREWTLGSVSP
jgi:hypothetical protein